MWNHPSATVPRHAIWLLATVTAALGVPGCRTYEPEPIDLDRIESAFEARRPILDGAPDARPLVDLASAEACALLLNADLRRNRAETGVTETAALHAGLWPDPTVGLQITRLLETSTSPWELFGSIGFTVPISGRLEAEKARFGFEHAARLVELENQEWTTRLALRDAWWRWLGRSRKMEATRGFLAAINELITVVDALGSTGELARVETRLFHLAALEAKIALEDLEAETDLARLEILDLAGLAPDLPVMLDPRDPPPLVLPPEPRHADAPSVRHAMAEYQVAEGRLEEAIRRQLPDLGVVPGYGTQDGQRQFGLGLALPVPILDGNLQAIEIATAERTSARIDVERALEKTAARIAGARLELEQAVRRRAVVEDHLVPLLKAQFEETRRLARLGDFDVLILLDGLQSRRNAEVALVDASIRVETARHALAAACGPATDPTVSHTGDATPGNPAS